MEVDPPSAPPKEQEPERKKVISVDIDESDDEGGVRGSTSPDSMPQQDTTMNDPEVDDGFDLDQGEPDLNRFWIPESSLRKESCCRLRVLPDREWSPALHCMSTTKCLHCAGVKHVSISLASECDERRAAAILQALSKKTDWIPLDTSTCFDFVMTVHANLRGTKYQKQISRLGGIRLGEERLRPLAQSGRLIDMHVQVNEDLSNRI